MKIVRDERLNPNSRLIATLIAMYLDSDQPKRMTNGVTIDTSEPIDEVKAKRDKDLMHDLIRAQFIDKGGKLRRTDPDIPTEGSERPSDLDKHYEDRFKAIFAEVAPSNEEQEGDDAAI